MLLLYLSLLNLDPKLMTVKRHPLGKLLRKSFNAFFADYILVPLMLPLRSTRKKKWNWLPSD